VKRSFRFTTTPDKEKEYIVSATSTTALTTPRQQTLAIQRPNPLLSVMTWELRRFGASRLFWIQALGFFGLELFITWFGRMPSQFTFQLGNGQNNSQVFSGFVAGTSAWGLLDLLPPALLTVLAILLPFVNADGVTRDLNRRTHELLMTTALPTWAYVWGRYLVGLLVSLGLALLLLASTLGMGLLLHLTIANYPEPVIGNVLLLWVGMVIPATILVSGLSFALGAVFPRQATLVKIIILVGWIFGAVIAPPSGGGSGDSTTTIPAWYVNWDPTSGATARGILNHYDTAFQNPIQHPTSVAQLQQLLLSVENMTPNTSGWLVPHLIIAVASLALVALAAFAFKRSRDVLS